MHVDPALQRHFEVMRAVGRQPFWASSVQQSRDFLDRQPASVPAGPPVFDVHDDTIVTENATVPIRIYQPSATLPVGTIVYLHGGGWVVGSMDSYDRLCRELTVRSGARIVSVDYRRAPEHTFPAAHDDAAAAVEWALDTFGRDPVGVAGDSAGGNLASYCAWQRGYSTAALAFQVLIYPVLDSDFTRASYRTPYPVPAVGGADIQWFWDRYVPTHSMRTDLRLVPLRRPIMSLPDTYLLIAGHDALRDEARLYADKLRRAGVTLHVDEYPDMTHGFLGLLGTVQQADQAMNRIAAWCTHKLENWTMTDGVDRDDDAMKGQPR